MISLPFCAEDVVNILASDGKQTVIIVSKYLLLFNMFQEF